MMDKQELNDEQKDFICKLLAQFIPHRKIAAVLQTKWPELGIPEKDIIDRIKEEIGDTTNPGK